MGPWVRTLFRLVSLKPRDWHLMIILLLALVIAGPPLDEEFWHVTDYYKNMKDKLRHLQRSEGYCYKVSGSLPDRVCRVPLQVSRPVS
jgi:hypothetical protein